MKKNHNSSFLKVPKTNKGSALTDIEHTDFPQVFTVTAI